MTAAAVLLGGALLAFAASRGRRPWATGADAPHSVGMGYRFEWIAWGAIGLVVMTGIGNLGAFGIHLQPPGSRWGTFLVAKLLLVFLFLPLSLVRSLAVAKVRAMPETALSPPAPSRFASLYAASFLLLLAILLLAVLLAHG